MAKRRTTERHIRKLARIGNRSLGVTLPTELLAELGWKKRQKVVVRRHRRTLIVSDWKK